ncbi:MAG: hypothetical protein IT168_11935 [Bryobacterales bacterium]|nr:hypothetical protein [Bryobacterales bacterium]
MRLVHALLSASLCTAWAGGEGDPRLTPLLEQLSEEASVFGVNAPRIIAQERLLHRGQRTPAFRIKRLRNQSKDKPPEVKPEKDIIEREIISEYAFGTVKDAADSLREFRQPISVDGRPVRGAANARLTLARNVSSDDDRERKRMLEQFEKLGLVGAATDFGQMILLFSRPALPRFHFNYKAPGRLAGSAVSIVQWYQLDSEASARVFRGNDMTRVKMKGEIWFRDSDNRPIRITALIPIRENDRDVVHEAEIDYYRSTYGVMLPRVVRYKKTAGKELVVENYGFYSNYRMFKVEAEIKFTPAEEEGTEPPQKPGLEPAQEPKR